MKYNNYLFLFLILVLTTTTLCSAAAHRNKTAVYTFGDSVFDSGNNNYLPTLCRADHVPYGPSLKKKGRFTDAELPSDILIANFGNKALLPAYLDLIKYSRIANGKLPYGATFASACSGFDDATSLGLGVLTLTKQFDYFADAYEIMETDIGLAATIKTVEAALFMVSGGSNDMLENYYRLPLRKIQYSISGYHNFLLSNLETFVKKLYKKGARRMGLLGMPPVGCIPMDITSFQQNNISSSSSSSSSSSRPKRRRCVSQHNSDAQEYNAKLEVLIKKFNIDMPLCKFAYIDIYTPLMNLIDWPFPYGIEETKVGCCGSGSIESGPLCTEYVKLCQEPWKYVFWDAAHPTSAVYRILTKSIIEKIVSDL